MKKNYAELLRYVKRFGTDREIAEAMEATNYQEPERVCDKIRRKRRRQ